VAANVVCIAGALGAGAPDVADRVASSLGFRVIDEEILVRAAHEAGVEPHVMADVEQRRSLLTRLLDGLGRSSDASMLSYGGMVLPPDAPSDALDLRGVIRTAVEETANEGRVVIVAHAASVALADREDVLRVLVTGSPAVRARRLAADADLSQGEAMKEIDFSDKARADYFKSFYDITEEVPTLYDLVVNTDRLTPADAAGLVLAAVQAPSSAA
jgi:cytidylate kinase